MPYQLRRIIAINIKNSTDGLPSGRIAELDPRGGVLAIGPNGVGKTTFLRLLPVFYGATASQILRGSGRSSFYSYLLSDPSSCVVFEYERETAEDIRCAVMYRVEAEDAPQFVLFKGGFQERFFYDEQSRFVLRDEFKARIESFGVETSRWLQLHQYRSVLLGVPLLTKEGIDLKRLAAQHSLGPRPLTHLERAAAAMANEKINFKDLQSIVIDRVVGGDGEAASAARSRHEIKKSRADVTQWLNDHEHTGKVAKSAPDADRLRAQVTNIRKLGRELGALRNAVVQALDQVLSERAKLSETMDRRRKEIETQKEELGQRLLNVDQQQKPLEEESRQLRHKVENARRDAEHFDQVGAAAAAIEQEREPELIAVQSALETEKTHLDERAGSVAESQNLRQRQLEAELTAQLQRLAQEESADAQTLLDAIQELDARRNSQISAIPVDDEAQSLQARQHELATRLGELQHAQRRPFASPEAYQEKDEADRKHQELNRDARDAAGQVATAERHVRDCERNLHDATTRMERLLAEVQEFAERVTDCRVQMQPKPGTLLAFLRSADSEQWSQAAKILEPQLLSRSDLDPQWAMESSESVKDQDAGIATVAGLQLNTEDINRPAWVEMADLQQRLRDLEAEAAKAQQRHAEASKAARAREQEHRKAKEAFDENSARQSLVNTALEQSEKRCARAGAVVAQQEKSCADNARLEIDQVEVQRRGLVAEAARLAQAAIERLNTIGREFDEHKNRKRQENADAQRRRKEEGDRANRAHKERVAQLHADVERELAGLGVDPQRVRQMQQDLQAARESLAGISKMRATVLAWREFQSTTAQEVPRWKEALDAQGQRLETLRGEQRYLREGLESLARDAKFEFDRYDTLSQRLNGEKSELEHLRDHTLKDFTYPGAPSLDVDWHAAHLVEQAEQKRRLLSTEAEAMEGGFRRLRNLMIGRTSGVQQWLEQREAELPDESRFTPLEWVCERAQVLVDWFDPQEHGPYYEQLHQEMMSIMQLADGFVSELELFDRKIIGFNQKLQRALGETGKFERFRDLSVTVRSGVAQLEYLHLLRKMKDVARSQLSTWRTNLGRVRELPDEVHWALLRAFRDMLPSDGVIRVNLSEQVRLECSLVENGRQRVITNQEEFAAVSSNGLTAMITACFLMGFVQMIRGPDSPVRLTWITDELGRFDSGVLDAFLRTLAQHNIDVISASPSVDPALASQFKRLAYFEPTGAIVTAEINEEDAFHATV